MLNLYYFIVNLIKKGIINTINLLQGLSLNIYIYGNNSFKKEIHETLEHANIKFKLGDSEIHNLDKLQELKEAIKNNPKDIYLIDDEKIIKNNLLTQKIKFLSPKDGIEQDFLFDNGIADISVDSLSQIPEYILEQYEKQKEPEDDIEESIKDIVDEAYEFDEEIELDEELAALLSSSTQTDEEIFPNNTLEPLEDDNNESDFQNDVNLDELEHLMDNDEEDENEGLTSAELEKLMNFQSDQGLNNVRYDYDDKNLISDHIESEKKIKNEDIIVKEEKEEDNYFDNLIKGEKMSNDFPELDSLNEEDILAALNGLDNLEISTTSNNPKIKKEVAKKIEQLEIEGSNVDDIAQLISKLLNNKTLEITVKIKD